MSLFEPVFRGLERAGVRYVVVGGVAVVLHGHARLTADLDIAVDLSPEAAKVAVDTLTGLGLRPRSPVDPAGFADPNTRARWASKQGMRVFSLVHPDRPMLAVDMFVEDQVDFEGLWARSGIVDAGGMSVRVASIPDLIELKRRTGRREDESDIAALEEIMKEREGEDG